MMAEMMLWARQVRVGEKGGKTHKFGALGGSGQLMDD
jgi:hypothetical protein